MRVVVDTNIFVSILIRPGGRLNVVVDYIDQNATVLFDGDFDGPR
jgi:predicted nucleic acid-binding protein